MIPNEEALRAVMRDMESEIVGQVAYAHHLCLQVSLDSSMPNEIEAKITCTCGDEDPTYSMDIDECVTHIIEDAVQRSLRRALAAFY